MDSSCKSKQNLHKCPEEGCTASYSKACRLEVHKRTHTGERPFICDVDNCTKSFTNPAHLKRHKSLVHERSCEVLCTVDNCNRVFNNNYSLKKHINVYHKADNMYKCAHCSESFKKKRQLKKHLLSHKGEDGLTCSICGISFASLHLSNKHKRNHKTYTCDCGVTFNRWTEFCQHRKASCSIKNIDHKCVICNKVFTTKENLKIHSLTHLEESQKESYYCPYLDCKRSYMYKKNLNSHIATYHEGKNNNVTINCTEKGCDVIFKSERNLERHILNVHKLPKKKKDRLPRKDAGTRKKCMASILSGVSLPLHEHLAIMNDGLIKNSMSNDTAIAGREVTISGQIKEVIISKNIPTSQLNDEIVNEGNSVPTSLSNQHNEEGLHNMLDTSNHFVENKLQQELVAVI